MNKEYTREHFPSLSPRFANQQFIQTKAGSSDVNNVDRYPRYPYAQYDGISNFTSPADIPPVVNEHAPSTYKAFNPDA